MRRDTGPVGPEELSAYLDGELDEEGRIAVESHVADRPEAAARLAEYRRRDQALCLAFAEVSADQARQPTPWVGRASRYGGRRFRLAIAAAILSVVVGTAGWWYGSAIHEDRALATLAREAVTAHLLYASQPGENPLVTADRQRMSERLSAILGAGVKAPNLSALGLRLIGLQEMAADRGPAALLVYRDADDRDVSCYFKRLADHRETDFTRQAAGGVNVIYRLDEHLGYAVVGTLPLGTLQQVAEAGYLQNAGEGE